MYENWLYQGESYCEECLPVSSESFEVYDGGGEQDTPANCSVCHRPLEYTLTQEGIEYVLEAIRESLEEKDGWEKVHDCYEGTYYGGSRHVEIVRDWAKELRNYWLDDADEQLVEHFLMLTEKPAD